MIRRLAKDSIRRALGNYPAVTLVGGRQCGKTTLAKSLKGRYFDLELEADRIRLDIEWDELASGRELVILDEAQGAPDVFPRLRRAIDAHRQRNGRFLTLGSVSPALMRSVGESLAGRNAIIELSPLLHGELATHAMRERLWLTGGFPDGGVVRASAFPEWGSHYVRLLSERDLPTMGIPSSPQVTHRLVRMLAVMNGQPWNASEVGRSMGLNYQTVAKYLDFIEGAYLVRRLPSFHSNLRKRLVKASKLLWRDTGLLHSLLGIATRDALYGHPMVGASWEAFVINQVLGTLSARGVAHDAYYFRTSDGYEVDLVLEFARERWAIEIKLTSDPTQRALERLESCASMVKATRSILVSRVADDAVSASRLSCGIDRLLKELAAHSSEARRR